MAGSPRARFASRYKSRSRASRHSIRCRSGLIRGSALLILRRDGHRLGLGDPFANAMVGGRHPKGVRRARVFDLASADRRGYAHGQALTPFLGRMGGAMERATVTRRVHREGGVPGIAHALDIAEGTIRAVGG